MAAPFSNCPVDGTELWILWSENIKASDIKKWELKLAICNDRRGLLSIGFLSLRDNARSHSTAATAHVFRQTKFEIIPRPLCISDLAQSYYHASGPLKDAFVGERLPVTRKLRIRCLQWLKSQPEAFFACGIRSFVNCCTKYFAKKERLCWETVQFVFVTEYCRRSN